MIKCDGFLKLLKLSCFGLLTSFFTLFVGSSVSAGLVQVIGFESSPSFVDSNYNLTFLKGGGLLSNYLGQGKSILAIDNNALFWWTPNGQPYFYDPSFQGFFGQYWSCDELTGLDSIPTNCSASPLDGDYVNLFKGFFNKVVVGDYSFYDFTSYHNTSPNGYSYGQTINVCWSSHEIGKSLCFRYSYCRISQGTSCKNRNYGSLTGSQNYSNLSFSNIPLSSIGLAPGAVGYGGDYSSDGDGSSNSNIDSNITGDYVFMECTVGAAKSYAENNLGLNPYVCYGGRDIDFTGISVLNPGQGSSVFDIYNASSDGKNFSDWFVYRKGIFDNRYVYNQSFWSGKEYIYDYFTLFNQYGLGLSARQVQDYCRIIVNDMSLTGKRTGIAGRCPSSFDGLPGGSGGGGGGGGGSWGDDSNGEVPIGVNWGNGQENKDTKTFIQDFFNKAKSNIPTNFTDIGGGFLPTYIITFLLAIILFKFLKH